MATEAQKDVLRELQRRHGVVEPQRLVEVARDPENPCHEVFDWDDSSAAQKWRLAQARQFIASVTVKETFHRVEVKVPAYERCPRAREEHRPGYRSVESIRRDRDDSRDALVERCRQIAADIRAMRQLALALGMEEEEVDAITERFAEFRRRVEAEA